MGAGIKNKVLQAWSMGKAVLATSMSVGGLEYEDGVNIVVRDDADAFVDELLRMLDDPARCERIGREARDTVLRSYRWEARSAQFERLLLSVCRPRAARVVLGRPARSRGGTGQRRVLMLALQFPPYGLSTGRLRTLGFVRHLPAAGWVPVVVTARNSAYENRDDRTLAEIPEGARVVRAAGVDMARLIAIRGVYPRLIATPDRWNTWALGAALSAVRAARHCRVDALWLTFPVPSAVLAGLLAHRLTGLPLVADLRDPMVYASWPELRWERAVYAWLERRVVKAASVVVLTTPGACELYRRRYPQLPARRFREIPNGIDDGDAAGGVLAGAEPEAGPLTLLHSGLIEVPDRDPAALFIALQMLVEQRRLPARGLRIVLRASGRDERFAADLRRLRIEPLVALAPRLPHREAMQEMQRASALLLLQGTPCNQQIPAKAYEYLAARRPIVGLMDPRGDTHALVHGRWKVPYCADLSDAAAIAAVLQRFIVDHEAGRAYVPPDALVDSFHRRTHASELAQVLDEVVDERAAMPAGLGQAASPPLDRELS
jgi:glycosyltransferase involved in cell wall biosynthesis